MIRRPCLLSIPAALLSAALTPTAAATCEADEATNLLANDGSAGDVFGLSVAVDGDLAVVGAIWDDDLGFNSGSTYVFERSPDGTWSQQAKLTASDGAANEVFGRSVGVSGDVIAVGANGDNGFRGAVYVFERSGSTWHQVAKLVHADAAPSDILGWNLSIDGDTIVSGAHFNDDAGSRSGSAYVFVRGAGGQWAQQAKLTASDAAADDEFGHDVAVSGDTILVGAYQDDDDGSSSGSVYVFERSGTTWTQTAKLTASDANTGYHFGRFLDLDGDTAVIGSPLHHPLNFGRAYVFERRGASWTETAQLTADVLTSQEWFASAVSLDGDVVLIGSFYIIGNHPGEVYLFQRDESGQWTRDANPMAGDGVNGDGFGRSVALAGAVGLVSADANDDNGPDSGSVYVFDVNCAGLPGDVNGDCTVNVLDLIDLLLCFGLPAVPGCEAEDINGDGTVNVLDLIALLLEFGTVCPGPCDVVCDALKTPELEPLCADEYVDATNGGCNSSPPVFSTIVCDEEICGEYGTFTVAAVAGRDTDWYKLVLATPMTLTWTVTGECPTLLGVIDNGGIDDCTGVTSFLVSAVVGPCETGSVVTACLGPGVWWTFVAPSSFAGCPCGSEYNAVLTCTSCVPAEPGGAP